MPAIGPRENEDSGSVDKRAYSALFACWRRRLNDYHFMI